MFFTYTKNAGNKAEPPTQRKAGDVGYDLTAHENKWLPLLVPRIVGTGVAIDVGKGHVAKFEDRSGMGAKGIRVLGGVIDPNYRGELKVILINLNILCPFRKIKAGDRIAQMLIFPVCTKPFARVVQLNETERGADGFGSSGR